MHLAGGLVLYFLLCFSPHNSKHDIGSLLMLQRVVKVCLIAGFTFFQAFTANVEYLSFNFFHSKGEKETYFFPPFFFCVCVDGGSAPPEDATANE